MTIDSGTDNLSNLGNMIRVNGEESRKIWNDKICDKIEGSDGSIFSPKLIQNRRNILKVYSKEMCRPISLKYHGNSYEKGIPTLRYRIFNV